MNFIDIKLEEYSIENSSEIPEYLLELERETNLTQLMPQMISGRLQGRLLSLLSKIINPKNILEIGTFTGYSALCLAEGLQKQGKLTTIEYDKELKDIVKKYISKSPYENQIEAIFGDALTVVPELNQTFDLVFIDAHKPDYLNYYNMLIPKMNSKGIIIADNVLWSGKVINQLTDKTAKAIDDFNKFVKNDDRVENIILPVRDGISLIRIKDKG